MYCKNCGKQLKDEIRFCPFCGTKTVAGGVGPAAGIAGPAGSVGRTNVQSPFSGTEESGTSAYPRSVRGNGGARRGKSLILGIVAAAVVMCVGVGVALAGLLGGNPRAKVEKAFTNTLLAYSKPMEDMGVAALMQLAEEKAYSADLSVTLKELPSDLYYNYDASLLEGLGMRIGVDASLGERAVFLAGKAFYGSTDLVEASISLDDTIFTVYSPEFLGDSALGVDTMTLGADLAELDPGNKDDYENIAFNIYDFLEKCTQTPEVDPAAVKALWEAVEVTEEGKVTVDINGAELECAGYSLLIPEDALRDYLDAAEDAVNAQGVDDALLELMESMGVPEYQIDYMKDDIKNAASGGEMFDMLKEAVKALGDVEIQVYLKEGYVMAVEWEPKIDGTQTEIGLYLGGGKIYQDRWSLVISSDGDELLVESEGDHTASSGRYTDVTTVTYTRGGSTYFELESELEYEPEANSDNFCWSVRGDGFTVDAKGQLTSSEESLELSLDSLELQTQGQTVLGLEVDYSIRPYEKRETEAARVKMIADLSLGELEDLYEEIQNNAQDWMYDLMDKVPALQDLM